MRVYLIRLNRDKTILSAWTNKRRAEQELIEERHALQAVEIEIIQVSTAEPL